MGRLNGSVERRQYSINFSFPLLSNLKTPGRPLARGMSWHRFHCNEEDQEAPVVRFVLRAMGCLFGCFRVRDSRSSSTAPETVVSCSKNSLSSLFLCDDELLRKGEEGRDPHTQELNVGELKAEAKFLKACGTLLQTPIEIRKESNKAGNESTHAEDEKFSNCNLRLPSSSNEILKLQKQSDESPSHVKVSEEWVTETPSSCLTNGDTTERSYSRFMQRGDFQKIITPMDESDIEISFENSSVLPEVWESNKSTFSSKESSPGHANQPSKHSGSASSRRERMASQYSNPLTFIDAMQIPGTPAAMNSAANEEVLKVSSQHDYSVVDPRKNPSKWNQLKDESNDSCDLRESTKFHNEARLMSTPMSELTEHYLSIQKLHATTYEDKVCRGKTPADRPILGMVAAHWHNDEACAISPKWWGGNGIPNSTNKYKEDQKVSWHATPFEERLEKALSEETSISQRKPMIGTYPIEFNESKESDSVPHLQPPFRQFKSVVSF